MTAVTLPKEFIEEKKFAEDKDEQAVQEWVKEFEESVDQADKCMRQLASKIELIDRKSKHEHKKAIALKSWPLSRRNSTCSNHKRSRCKLQERLVLLL